MSFGRRIARDLRVTIKVRDKNKSSKGVKNGYIKNSKEKLISKVYQ